LLCGIPSSSATGSKGKKVEALDRERADRCGIAVASLSISTEQSPLAPQDHTRWTGGCCGGRPPPPPKVSERGSHGELAREKQRGTQPEGRGEPSPSASGAQTSEKVRKKGGETAAFRPPQGEGNGRLGWRVGTRSRTGRAAPCRRYAGLCPVPVASDAAPARRFRRRKRWTLLTSRAACATST
jgi:hypothetical protein